MIKIFLAFMIFTNASMSEVLRVPDDYSSIQSAIDNSSDFDTVMVSPGFYSENLNYNGKNIVVTSAYAIDQDSLLIETTIIDGSQNGSVVIFESNETVNAVLSGFTIQNGDGYFADPDENGTFYTYGGGIYCKGADPTLKDLIISNNVGNVGGGGGIFLYEASPRIEGCLITNNFSDDVGGGLYSRFSNFSMSNTQFIANEAELGSGCYLRNESTPSLTNVDFKNNLAANSGGGVVLKDNSNAILVNVKFINNLAEGLGGGLYINNANPYLDFVLIALNVASAGGGIYLRNNSNLILNHSTVAYNSSGFDAGGIYLRDNSSVVASNSIFWENGDSQFYFRESGDEVYLSINFSLVQNSQEGVDDNNNGDVVWGDGMFDSDPFFCDLENSDFSVRENSSVLFSGSEGGLVGFAGIGCGPVNTGPVWYVSELGDDSDDGSINFPFAKIQTAIDASQSGDTIRLFQGEYVEVFNFQSKQIVLESRADELMNDSLIAGTRIIAGQMGGACIELIGQEASGAEIKNITFSGGQSQIGGGIYIENSTPKFSGIVVEENSAEVGGGIYINQSIVNLKDSQIFGNVANFGGGIYATSSSVSLQNVLIDTNLAYWGAGIYSENSTFEVIKSEIMLNYAYIEGGGLYQNGNNILFQETALVANTGLDFGGAISCHNGTVEFNYCTVAANNANYGSAINFRESTAEITNSIFWDDVENSIHSNSSSQMNLMNIDFTNFYGLSNATNFNQNITINWGATNLASDPLFCNPNELDFGLQENSMCLNASETLGTIGAYLQICEDQLLVNNLLNKPNDFRLLQNFPNPFNPETNIFFKIYEPGVIDITIYNLRGELVKNLTNKYFFTGEHSIKWSARDNKNLLVPSGMYICKVTNGKNTYSMKMALVK